MRLRYHLPMGVLACLAVLAVFLGVQVSVAGAATTLSTCYGQPPTIVGTTDAGETLYGTPGDDVIIAGAGDDTIYGNGGHDIICAGAGNDFVITGNDSVTIAGEAGNDVLYGSIGNDYIDGGIGDDNCPGYGGADRIYGCTYPTTFVVGQSAPDLVARTAFDNRFRLANLIGQNVMIDFSTMWCGPSVQMALETASVQANLRRANVPFTYVLGEVEGFFPGNPSTRSNAENMSEHWGLGQVPVLHAEGSASSQLTTQSYEYDSENVAYDPTEGSNDFLPTLVFINKSGQAIEDHYKLGLPAPTQLGPTGLLVTYVGTDIENERSAVDALTIAASAKQTLEGQLTNAEHALDLWLKPKTSACDWMKQFDSTLAKTRGIGSADLADLRSGSQNIESKLACSKK